MTQTQNNASIQAAVSASDTLIEVLQNIDSNEHAPGEIIGLVKIATA